MFVGVGFMALDNVAAGVGVGVGCMAGLVIFLLGALASFLTRLSADQSLVEWFDVWVFAGSRNLRRTFQVWLASPAFSHSNCS